jgi:hypothetical protein
MEKVKFGLSNFIEKTTPPLFQLFCLDRIVDLLLVGKWFYFNHCINRQIDSFRERDLSPYNLSIYQNAEPAEQF